MRKFFRNGVPKGNRTYVDAETPGKSVGLRLARRVLVMPPVPVEPVEPPDTEIMGDNGRL